MTENKDEPAGVKEDPSTNRIRKEDHRNMGLLGLQSDKRIPVTRSWVKLDTLLAGKVGRYPCFNQVGKCRE